MTVRWESAGATHTGRVRKSNEDSFRVDDTNGVFIVADGMGGHAAGEIASSMAAEAAARRLSEEEKSELALAEAFRDAHQLLVECCERDPRTEGMGTTMTAATLDDTGTLRVGHLGDSRAYLLRAGSLTQLTRDHTWVQREIDAGRLTAAAARNHHLGHILTRVLTAEDPAVPDLLTTIVEPGDTLLLCSDGLHNLIDHAGIRELLDSDLPLTDVVSRFVRVANRRGGNDNITAVVVRVE